MLNRLDFVEISFIIMKNLGHLYNEITKLYTVIVSCSCFALSSEEFDKQYQNLNGELNKAVINNMIYSKDYDKNSIVRKNRI
jgi:hypothetical protein